MSRQRNVYPTDRIAHLWAHATQPSARNAQGNFSFSGANLISYSTVIAVRRSPGLFIVSDHSYSITTGKQQYLARRAIPHDATQIYVDDASNPISSLVDRIREQAAHAAKPRLRETTRDAALDTVRTSLASLRTLQEAGDKLPADALALLSITVPGNAADRDALAAYDRALNAAQHTTEALTYAQRARNTNRATPDGLSIFDRLCASARASATAAGTPCPPLPRVSKAERAAVHQLAIAEAEASYAEALHLYDQSGQSWDYHRLAAAVRELPTDAPRYAEASAHLAALAAERARLEQATRAERARLEQAAQAERDAARERDAERLYAEGKFRAAAQRTGSNELRERATARIPEEDAAAAQAWRERAPNLRAPNSTATLLRLTADGTAVETSRGAEVPLDAAQELFRLAQHYRTIGASLDPGKTMRVGHYTLTRITEIGTVVVGCHVIEFDEAQRFAQAQGWTP